jgi:hypothetical protein
MTRPHTLDVATDVRDTLPVTLLLVDDVDILEREELPLRPDALPHMRPFRYNPVDPAELLPPESRLLLPASHGTQVMIGVCTCWTPGCGSLWMSLRREHDTVVWAPSTNTPSGSIRHEYRFSLRPYLDALDNVTHRSQEDPARRIARELRAIRDSLFGLPSPGRVLDIGASPGYVHISTVDRQAVAYHKIPVAPTDTVAHVVAALNHPRQAPGPSAVGSEDAARGGE